MPLGFGLSLQSRAVLGRASGLPGTLYPLTSTPLPAPLDALRRAGLGTRVDAAGAVAFGPTALGSNLTPTYDFTTAGTAGAVTGRTANSYTTSGSGGVRLSSVVAIGKTYEITVTGTTTATQVNVRNPGDLNGAQTFTTASFTRTWVVTWSTIAEIYIQNETAGTTTITSLSVREVSYLPRPTHNPSTLAALGVLFEGQATNGQTTTNNCASASWTALSATKTANAGADPWGGNAGALIVATTGGHVASLFNASAQAMTPGSKTTAHFYIRQTVGTSIRVRLSDGVTGQAQWDVNTVTGATTKVTDGPFGATSCSARFLTASNYWQVVISGTQPVGQTQAIVGWYFQNSGDAVLAYGGNTVVGELTSDIPNPTTGTAVRTGDFAGGGISGAALTALFNPTQPFTLAFSFRKGYTLASVETLLGLCAGASAGGTNQLGIATNGTQAQIIHSGGSGALTGALSTTALNKIAVSVDPTWRGVEIAQDPTLDTALGAGVWANRSTGTGSAVISGGQAVIFGPDGSNRGWFTQSLTLVSGQRYEVDIDVVSVTGACFLIFGTSSGTGAGALVAGRYTVAVTAGGTGIFFGAQTGSAGGSATISLLSVRQAGAASISVNGAAPVETTGIAYTGAGTTALIPGARDSSGGQAAVGFTWPELRVVAGQYITGSALQALSV